MPIFELDGASPDLAKRCWIAPDANVIGRVRLLTDASVWFGATLRGDNDWITIGKRSNIQDGCVLHVDAGVPLTVGADCTIGHRAILHGCAVGDGTLIGMGAIILNGARIGRGCLVGANTLVTEGKEFPDHSLVIGSPAKVTRQLDTAAIERLLQSAGNYVRNWQRFQRGLKQL